ncbi:MAG: hypothetical protein GQF41_0762 [Candidatus Rifleibacterium amylolyticum]|nr:MAG: hypothetical protein GQF41_0762 [Candidatus Rifleibacterium amylolyticum]
MPPYFSARDNLPVFFFRFIQASESEICDLAVIRAELLLVLSWDCFETLAQVDKRLDKG